MRPNIFEIRKNILYKEKVYMMSLAINRTAFKRLKLIEKRIGYKLSNSLISQCDEYAKDILGHKKYAPGLYVYAAMENKFKEGWIPENYHFDHYVIKNDALYSDLSELKPLTSRILNTNYVPDLIYINNGKFIEPSSLRVISKEQAFKIAFAEQNRVIFKSNNSKQGRGVTFVDKLDWQSYHFEGLSGVVQKIINQHNVFNQLFPYPGATIRLTSVFNNKGIATVRAAYLRLGRDDAKSNSTHVMSENHIRVGIDLETGEFFEYGHTPSLEEINSHPDTNKKFKGLVIPNFRTICSKIEDLHTHFPFVTSIGWDVTVNDKEELEIMEWNTANNGIIYDQIIYGPCFADLIVIS